MPFKLIFLMFVFFLISTKQADLVYSFEERCCKCCTFERLDSKKIEKILRDTEYSEDDSNESNCFVLIKRLEKIVKDIDVPVKDLKFLDSARELEHFKYMNEENHILVFWDIVALRKSVIERARNNTLQNYIDLFPFLNETPGSLQNSIKQTIDFFLQSREQGPDYTIKNRIENFFNVFKKPIYEKLWLPLGKTCSCAEPPEVAVLLIKKIYARLGELAGTYRKNEDLEYLINREIFDYQDYRYENNSLVERMVVFTKILQNPKCFLSEEMLAEFQQIVGYLDEKEKKSFMGILGYCKKQAYRNYSPEIFKDFTSEIGTTSDVTPLQGESLSLLGVFNFIFERIFEQVLITLQKTEDALDNFFSLISQEYNFNVNLEIEKNRLKLCLIRETVGLVLEQKQFSWADCIFEGVLESFEEVSEILDSCKNLQLEELQENSQVLVEVLKLIQTKLDFSLKKILGSGITLSLVGSEKQDGFVSYLQKNNVRDIVGSINKKLNKDKEFWEELDNGTLFSLVGAPNQGLLFGQLSTMNSRLLYMQEIAGNLAPFVDFYFVNKWQGLLCDKGYGLLHKLSDLEDFIEEKKVIKAVEILGRVQDTAGTYSIFSIINLFLNDTFNHFFSTTLKDQTYYDFELDICCRTLNFDLLKNFQIFLNENKQITTIDALMLLGKDSDDSFSSSLFGRLSLVEATISSLFKQSYYIPIAKILEMFEGFSDAIKKLQNSIWSAESIEKIGKSLSPISEDSFFGRLNCIMSTLLTLPIAENIKSIENKIGAVISLIEKNTQLLIEEKQHLLQLILPSSTVASLLQLEFVPEQTVMPLLSLQSLLLDSFLKISGFWNLDKVAQIWPMIRKIQNIFTDIEKELNPKNKRYDAFGNERKTNSEIVTFVCNKIGVIDDFADSKKESIFSVTADIAIRMSSMYSVLDKWLCSDEHIALQAQLTEIKNHFFPGTCKLFLITNLLEKIHKSVFLLANDINKILDSEVETEDFNTGNNGVQTIEKLPEGLESNFDDILSQTEEMYEFLGSLCEMLPHTLGYYSEEVFRFSDILSPLFKIEEKISLFQKKVKDIRCLYVPEEYMNEYAEKIDLFSCSALPQYLEKIGNEFVKIGDTFARVVSERASEVTYYKSKLPIGLKLKEISIFLKALESKLHIIRESLLLHREAQRKFSCLNCEVSLCLKNLSFLISSFENLNSSLQKFTNLFISSTELSNQQLLYCILDKIKGAQNEEYQTAAKISLKNLQKNINSINQIMGFPKKQMLKC